MGQLSDRLRVVLRAHGFEPAARASELAALASMEEQDPKAAHARFLELKRQFAAQRRADVLAALRAFPFVRNVPPTDTRGMTMKDVEADLRDGTRALALAREVAASLDEEARARAALQHRAPPEAAALAPAAWTALAPFAKAAEARRRATLRELRVEERALAAAKRARKAGVDAPSTHALDADEADAALDALETRLREKESIEEARERAARPLRDPAVREWRHDSAKRLAREVADAGTVEALRALEERAVALRVEAAGAEDASKRARRAGRPAPARERRAGDPMDPYG